MSQSVISVIGKDRVGIVYDVAKILAENQINIVNISQQLMGEFFTMIIWWTPVNVANRHKLWRNCLPTRVCVCI